MQALRGTASCDSARQGCLSAAAPLHGRAASPEPLPGALTLAGSFLALAAAGASCRGTGSGWPPRHKARRHQRQLRALLRRGTGGHSCSAAPQQVAADREELDWAVPLGYNWEVCTQKNYEGEPGIVHGSALAAIRELTDAGYHGGYTPARQRFQDEVVTQLINRSSQPRRRPMLLFTAGAMGVGKSFLIHWMKERGLLPLDEFVVIDPDQIAQRLPEWPGYFAHDPAIAALMTRLEAGLLTELALVAALQNRCNILVDSSLRHGSWYSRVLQRLRCKLPDVRVVLMYVHTHEETIQQRAADRGRTGRMVSSTEVSDSLQRMSNAVSRLLPYVDFFAQVANDGMEPQVTSTCGDLLRSDDDHLCEVLPPHGSTNTPDVGWDTVQRVLATASDREPMAPLAEPPRVLPTSDATELWPLEKLLRTMVFAATKHQHHLRKDPQGTPYINHPLAVSRIILEEGIRDLPTLQAALLHDTLEDTATTSTELQTLFGTEVTVLVESLTDDDSLKPTTKKLVQLRGAPSLPQKAKLVRIADKLHNIWDILHHGIPGWSQARKEQYIAWACELVSAIGGAHEGLERRFHREVSLPPGYELGDWERHAAAHMSSFDGVDLAHAMDGIQQQESGEVGALPEEPVEYKGLFSLLLAAEFLAQRARSDSSGIVQALNVALVLAQQGVRSAATLQAALLQDVVNGRLGSPPVPLEEVGGLFDQEVVRILAALTSPVERGAPADARESSEDRVMPHEAKLVCLAEHLWSLQDLQLRGLADQEAESTFRRRVQLASRARRSLAGTHSELEDGLDDILSGHVRLASGELVPAAWV